MPTRRNNKPPPKTMTLAKASPVIAVCIAFDALRIFFEQFWFFGPALAAGACTAIASSWVGSLWGATAAVCGTVVAVTSYWDGGATIESFGVLMAMAVGLMGWLVVGLILIWTNARTFEENAGHALWFAVSLVVSEIPIIGTIPALTGVVWSMYRTQIKKETAALRKYEEEQAAALVGERQQQQLAAAELMQARALQQAQAAAAAIY